jgi:RecB family endonuclease NucS
MDELKRVGFVPVEDEARYRKLLSIGYEDRGLTKRGKHHIMVLANVAQAGDNDDAVDALETTFGLEDDLQKALRKNIEQLEPGLRIVDGDKERIVESGRIDILAEDSSGTTVIIELKAGVADRDAVGQIAGYMGDFISKGEAVRGILVAGDFPARAISAAKAIPNLQLRKYGFQFSFEPVGSQIAQAVPAA